MSDDQAVSSQTSQFEAEVSQVRADPKIYDFTQSDLEFLLGLWANFSIKLEYPVLEQTVSKWIEPQKGEYVHRIQDYGNELYTSRGEAAMHGNRSFNKLMQTVEKMVILLVTRAKEVFEEKYRDDGSDSINREIRVSFGGFELLQRKAFRACIELPDQVSVTNFDPGEWGERQLRCFNELLDKGYLRLQI